MLENIEKISIIIPSFNYDLFIVEAIESILKQSYKDWELIIVDDGSKDNSVRVIEKYIKKCNKIKLFFHPNKENKGLAETYKLGLKHCSGDYIAFIDADDIWKHSDYLSSKINIFKRHKDVILVYNDVEVFGSNKIIKDRMGTRDHIDEANKKNKERPFFAFEYLSVFNCVYTFSCFVVRAELLKNHVDISDRLFGPWLDWWILGQLSVQGKFYFQSEKKTKWRFHDKSYDQQLKSSGENLKNARLDIISNAVAYLNKGGKRHIMKNDPSIGTQYQKQVKILFS